MKTLQTRTIVAAAFALLVGAGCGTQVDVVPGTPAPPPPDTTTPPVTGQPAIDLSANAASPGDDVRVTASNFAPGATVRIGFGPRQSEYDVLTTTTADGSGTAQATVEVPDWADAGTTYVFVAAEPDNDPRVISPPFHITNERGMVTVTGRITTEGTECLALRTADNQLYTLTGDTGDFGPGDRVEVQGTLPAASICMQGTTISVERIRGAG